MKSGVNEGKVCVVLGPVVDVKFETKLPKIFEKILVDTGDGFITLELWLCKCIINVYLAIGYSIFNVPFKNFLKFY